MVDTLVDMLLDARFGTLFDRLVEDSPSVIND